jgi:hypothetical protein
VKAAADAEQNNFIILPRPDVEATEANQQNSRDDW